MRKAKNKKQVPAASNYRSSGLRIAPETFLRLTMWSPPLFFACSFLFFTSCLIRTGCKPFEAARQVVSHLA
jgi:hypothetical protein